MLKYGGLNQNLKDLYNSLKDAIQNNGDVADVLKDKEAEDIALVVGVVDDNGSTLLIDAIEKNNKAATKIRERIDQENISTAHATDALENKTVSDILNGSGEVAKAILNWASPYKNKNVKMFIANKLKEEFKNAVKSGDFEKANTLYEFGEHNQPNIFKFDLLQGSWLSDAISEIKCNGNNKFLENTLEFAARHKMLDEVFKAKIGRSQKTLLGVAEEEGVKEKVEGVIRDAEIDIDKYKKQNYFGSAAFKEITTPTYPASDNKQSTFYSRNKEKIAFGVVGSLLLAGCIVAVCTLGPPAIGGAAIVGATIGVVAAAVIGAAMMLMSVLAITTDRGDEMWSSMLKDLCISKQGPKEQGI